MQVGSSKEKPVFSNLQQIIDTTGSFGAILSLLVQFVWGMKKGLEETVTERLSPSSVSMPGVQQQSEDTRNGVWDQKTNSGIIVGMCCLF